MEGRELWQCVCLSQPSSQPFCVLAGRFESKKGDTRSKSLDTMALPDTQNQAWAKSERGTGGGNGQKGVNAVGKGRVEGGVRGV